MVSTPIGNLEDITLRAVSVLKDCDVIACEDTRNTKKLLDRYGIKTPPTSYHEHNEVEKSPKLLENSKRVRTWRLSRTPELLRFLTRVGGL